MRSLHISVKQNKYISLLAPWWLGIWVLFVLIFLHQIEPRAFILTCSGSKRAAQTPAIIHVCSLSSKTKDEESMCWGFVGVISLALSQSSLETISEVLPTNFHVYFLGYQCVKRVRNRMFSQNCIIPVDNGCQLLTKSRTPNWAALLPGLKEKFPIFNIQ